MENHHVSISQSSASCAILELSGITPQSEKVLYALATRLYHPARGTPASFVLWSDVVEDEKKPVQTNGVMLYSLIRKLGWSRLILDSHIIENPLTGNPIQVWLWELPHEEFKKWYREERVRRAGRF